MTKRTKKRLMCLALALSLLVAAVLIITPVEKAEAAVVKQGDRGSLVRTIQTRLKNWGYYFGYVDGIYGSQTVAAVKYFQRTHGLVADGIVGRYTASKIGVNLNAASTASTGGASSSDLYLLSCCVYGEARGESYTGKVAIAAVVLNRVKSSSFPNTIAGVIYQSGAFTCVSDGQINLGTNDECTRAAQDALNGWDPTYGSLFYYNPATATNQWIRSKRVITTIGKHIFCA